jgi:hypothetical protein
LKKEAGTGGRFLLVNQQKEESGEPWENTTEGKFLGPRVSPLSLRFTFLLHFYELRTHTTDRPRLHCTPAIDENTVAHRPIAKR